MGLFGECGNFARKLSLRHADEEEKKQVAKWVRAAMNAARRAGNELSDNWRRQAYGGFLLRLEANALDDEAYLQLCREAHRLNDLVTRLLKLRRVDEARDEAARAGDYELLTLADVFVQHKQIEVVERLMTERAKTTKDTRIFEWLKERSKQRDNYADALMWARKINDVRPSLEQYRETRKLATRVGTWTTARAELLANLEQRKDFSLLTQIHLDEKDIDAALRTVEKTQGGFPYFSPDLRLAVAKAAEETRPRDALRIYLQVAERIIQARDRGAYVKLANTWCVSVPSIRSWARMRYGRNI
jgi:tetratricopeptide (TPR) repeat protein